MCKVEMILKTFCNRCSMDMFKYLTKLYETVPLYRLLKFSWSLIWNHVASGTRQFSWGRPYARHVMVDRADANIMRTA